MHSELRNPYFDYLKMFAMYMVILGHVLTNCMQGGMDTIMCMFLYSVHIPLFLSVSAFFVRDKKMDVAFWTALFKKFLVPYCVWTLLLTIFYLGITRIQQGGIAIICKEYLMNLCTGFWFIRAFLITYILWQGLQFLHNWWRMIIGTVFLFLANWIMLKLEKVSEILSLSLYTYTLYSLAVCLKPYFLKYGWKKVTAMSVMFLVSISIMKPEYDYFRSSFTMLSGQNMWWVFIVRLVAGLSFSMLLVNLSSVIEFPRYKFLQNIGQYTLQIYMLQALFVEGILPRILHFQNNEFGGIGNYCCNSNANIKLCFN